MAKIMTQRTRWHGIALNVHIDEGRMDCQDLDGCEIDVILARQLDVMSMGPIGNKQA